MKPVTPSSDSFYASSPSFSADAALQRSIRSELQSQVTSDGADSEDNDLSEREDETDLAEPEEVDHLPNPRPKRKAGADNDDGERLELTGKRSRIVPHRPPFQAEDPVAANTHDRDDRAAAADFANAEAPPEVGRKEKRKQRKNKHKKEKREEKKTQHFLDNTKRPKQEDVNARIGKARSVSSDLNPSALPATGGAYEASRKGASQKSPTVLNYEGLKAQGYETISWDGREPLFVEESGTSRLVVVGVGMPTEASYMQAVGSAHELLVRLGQTGEWTADDLKHKRGRKWAAVNTGLGVGTGNPPYNQSSQGHDDVVEALLSSPALKRLAVHQSESLKFYMPRLYKYYHDHATAFRAHNPHLRVNWDCSVFCSAACNLGPQVITAFHRNCRNLPFGFCAIHAMGHYDYTIGGHLVLKELKLMIQFPPGALFLIPSATITHGNTPLKPGETRTSFTQYTSGSIFRFVDNGCMTEAEFKAAGEEAYEKKMQEKLTRWKMGLSLWSTKEELLCPGQAGKS